MSKPITTGTFLINFDSHSASGTYTQGKRSGTWTAMVRINGDQFCLKINKNKEGCVYLYLDGNTVYEVNARGVLESVNRKK
jgi:hypothetical protein